MVASNKIKSATIWSSVEALSSLILGVVSIVFLARLLSPQDYGQIATAQFVSALIQMVLGFGLIEAIIQKKDITKEHISSVLTGTILLGFCGLILCTILAILFYIYGDNKNISIILLAEGVTTFLVLASTVPSAILMRHLEMRSYAQRNIISRVIFFIVAIPLVLYGFGLWSVVIANLVQAVIAAILIFLGARKLLEGVYLKYDPILFKDLSKFGVFVMFENLLWSVMTRVFGILIAAFHGAHALGIFNMATRLTDTVLNILNTAIGRLALPVFSNIQDDALKLNNSFQKATHIFNLLSMPAFLGMAYTANEWVPLVLGAHWTEAAPIIQIISIMYAIMFSRIFVGTAIKAVGKSKQYLYLSLIAAIITIVGVFITRNMSLQDAILVWAFPRLIITIPLGIYFLKILCNIGIVDQVKPLFYPITISLIMLLGLWGIEPFLSSFTNNIAIFTVMQISFGIFIYVIVFLFLFKRKLLYFN